MIPSQERRETFPNGIEAFFLVVALFGLEYLVGAAFRDAGYFQRYNLSDVSAVIQLVGNGLLFSGLLAYKRLSYASLFHPAPHSVIATVGTLSLPILLLVPGLLLAMSAVESMLVWYFPLSRAEQAMFERMMAPGLGTLVAVCILAPILEEMLFRGVILRSFLHQYPRHTAILASATLFGLAHMNIYQFVVGLALGSLAGWLYERARSLWPCIFLHSTYNSLIAYLSLTAQDPPQGLGADLPVMYWFAAATAALLGTTMLRRMLGQRT
jgi:membrane protease YdiL (CAAX protease family)